MAAARDSAHLASASLAAEVQRKVRERGLVVWLDAEGQYTTFVDGLAAGRHEFGFPVIGLRGSFLELMLALEGYGSGLDPDKVLVHLPGLNKDSVKETPAYELAAAGTTFERNLATLVSETALGVATPEELVAFLGSAAVSLDAADTWLAERAERPTDGLSLLLHGLGLEGVVVALLEGDRRFEGYLPIEGDKLLGFLEKELGLSPEWRRFWLGDAALRLDSAAVLVATWLMAVEFVSDLAETPVTPELRPLASLGPHAGVSRRLVARFRDQRPDVYEELAGELQERLVGERTSHHAGALGSVDTLRFEESSARAAALSALVRGDWATAKGLAASRTPEKSFWVKRSPELQRTWELVRVAAEAGTAFAATATVLARCASLEEATARYAQRLAPVDRIHRHFEQRAEAVILTDLEDHGALIEVREAVHKAHRSWTNGINRAFFELCVRHGPLPGRSLRQRAIYDDVVHPMVERGDRVAYFLVDALRYEMAQGLAEDLGRDKFKVKLEPRLAELPTDTVIGMNALAPVEQEGRLRVVLKNGSFAGFKRRDFAVSDPASRVRAMGTRSLRSGTPVRLSLEALQDMSLTKVKSALSGKPSLIVVHSRDIDTAGEHGLHLSTIDHTLGQLKSAVSLLAQAGVERFVIASDHGFLLQDSTTENAPFGSNKTEAERRYALRNEPSGMSDVLEVRLSRLEYDADPDVVLVFAPDTAVWKRGEDVPSFAHGGNSLQERVVPVLEIERTVKPGRSPSKYEVVARPEPARLGRQRLRIAVRLQSRETAMLGFFSPKTISLALRVVGRSDLAITILDAQPPAELVGGRILVPPSGDDAVVEFEVASEVDDKVRVEVFHPDAREEVTPKIVEGFFDATAPRRPGKPMTTPTPPVATREGPSTPSSTPVAPQRSAVWEEFVTDDGYKRVLKIVEQQRSINEEELLVVLGSPRRVRAFARIFDDLVRLLPFDVEVRTAGSMKVYTKKD